MSIASLAEPLESALGQCSELITISNETISPNHAEFASRVQGWPGELARLAELSGYREARLAGRPEWSGVAFGAERLAPALVPLNPRCLPKELSYVLGYPGAKAFFLEVFAKFRYHRRWVDAFLCCGGVGLPGPDLPEPTAVSFLGEDLEPPQSGLALEKRCCAVDTAMLAVGRWQFDSPIYAVRLGQSKRRTGPRRRRPTPISPRRHNE